MAGFEHGCQFLETDSLDLLVERIAFIAGIDDEGSGRLEVGATVVETLPSAAVNPRLISIAQIPSPPGNSKTRSISAPAAVR